MPTFRRSIGIFSTWPGQHGSCIRNGRPTRNFAEPGCARSSADGEIASVPDGIVFPILSALAVFVFSRRLLRKRPSGAPLQTWLFKPVEQFDEKEIIEAAAQVYMEIADHHPQTMGKSKACYSALQRITAI